MPVLVCWHNDDHTIIREEFSDPWGIDDFLAIMTDLWDMMDSVDHQVHTICVINSKNVPDDSLTRMPEVVRKAPGDHPHEGIVVVVTSSPLVESVARIYSKVYKPIYLARTVEGAEQIIEEWE